MKWGTYKKLDKNPIPRLRIFRKTGISLPAIDVVLCENGVSYTREREHVYFNGTRVDGAKGERAST